MILHIQELNEDEEISDKKYADVSLSSINDKYITGFQFGTNTNFSLFDFVIKKISQRGIVLSGYARVNSRLGKSLSKYTEQKWIIIFNQNIGG